jgi:hypothetical protein
MAHLSITTCAEHIRHGGLRELWGRQARKPITPLSCVMP